MDREAQWATVHGVAKSRTTSEVFLERLKDQGFIHKAVGIAYLPFTRQNVSAVEILESLLIVHIRICSQGNWTNFFFFFEKKKSFAHSEKDLKNAFICIFNKHLWELNKNKTKQKHQNAKMFVRAISKFFRGQLS